MAASLVRRHPSAHQRPQGAAVIESVRVAAADRTGIQRNDAGIMLTLPASTSDSPPIAAAPSSLHPGHRATAIVLGRMVVDGLPTVPKVSAKGHQGLVTVGVQLSGLVPVAPERLVQGADAVWKSAVAPPGSIVALDLAASHHCGTQRVIVQKTIGPGEPDIDAPLVAIDAETIMSRVLQGNMTWLMLLRARVVARLGLVDSSQGNLAAGRATMDMLARSQGALLSAHYEEMTLGRTYIAGDGAYAHKT
jgi:hypothetical protein